ncbi:MlaD family protein [Winogradskyella sp. 3972H.M.0a.05]|uniref:MlaD family protein n=1 Tax=Winogradskyella sp. 3972H.M.0a.05 TaxID=2950277 RepID=UPI003392C102
MKISKEIKVALLVLSGIALFIYLFSYLKGEDIFTAEDTYYTEFDYNALSTSSPVTIKGNAVGKVEDIKYDFKTGKTRVSFSVDPQLKFSKNSIIRLYETGIMGGNALAIIKANDGEMAKTGDFLKSEVQPGLVSSLSKNFSGLSANLDATLRSTDTLLTNLNKLVIDDSDAGIKATIAELNSTLKSFKTLSYTIDKAIKENDGKISLVLENVNKTSENLATLSDDLKDVEISKTITKLDNTLGSVNAVLRGLENGDGTMGKLLKDDKLYNNLEGASKELELLLLDIKLHPARYRRILSKKEIPYEPPTEEQKN